MSLFILYVFFISKITSAFACLCDMVECININSNNGLCIPHDLYKIVTHMMDHHWWCTAHTFIRSYVPTDATQNRKHKYLFRCGADTLVYCHLLYNFVFLFILLFFLRRMNTWVCFHMIINGKVFGMVAFCRMENALHTSSLACMHDIVVAICLYIYNIRSSWVFRW